MFSFFKNNHPDQLHFGALGTDMHAHLLPAIDDGPQDVDASIQLINGLKELGYKKLIATPHVMSERYPNSRDHILRQRDQLSRQLEQADIQMELFDAAAEYYLDETFEKLLRTEPLLCLPGNYVLIEMAFFQEYPNLHAVLFELQMKGYKPVLAHPERYLYYRNLEDFQRLKDMGCLLQVNLLSLTGYYHPSAKNDARLLIQHGLVDFLGTDIHHAGQLENMKKACSDKWAMKALQLPKLLNQTL
ncbi:MAG: hypothetical protein JNJ57_22130 [Saprospiraceae bacterium]|nr:hypothetical protein [Saprospiraceae bacterium]